jgi:hypothetical protein
MATAVKKGASSQLDPAAKKKVIIACVMLGLAVVLIGWNLIGSTGNPNAGPSVSEPQAQQMEETHKKELQKVKEETDKGYKGNTPPAAPSGA